MPILDTNHPARMWGLSAAFALAAITAAGCGGADGAAPEPEPESTAPAPAPTPAPAPIPAPPPPSAAGPTITPLGTPEGFAVAQTVGPAGGTVASAGGRLEIRIPPGALAAPTEITIQPITNTMPNGIGQAYRLGPEGTTFAVPVKIRFNAIPDDLDGTDFAYVDMLSQTSQGTWEAYPAQVADTGARSVTIDSLHFSDWATHGRYRLEPPSAALSVGEQLTLTLKECRYLDTPKPPVTDPNTGLLVSPGTYKALDCSQGATTALLDQWTLDGNDIATSPTSLGTLVPTNTARAGYKAPDQVPDGSVVVASARLQAESLQATPRLRSKITITDKPGYSLYAERKEESISALLSSRLVISSVASGRWIYSEARSATNQAPTWFPRGHVTILYELNNPECVLELHGGADFDETLQANGLLKIPGTTKFSGAASVIQVTLTGESQCANGETKPASLTIEWSGFISADQSPADALVTPDANGKLAGANRQRSQRGGEIEVVEQTFKFLPDGR